MKMKAAERVIKRATICPSFAWCQMVHRPFTRVIQVRTKWWNLVRMMRQTFKHSFRLIRYMFLKIKLRICTSHLIFEPSTNVICYCISGSYWSWSGRHALRWFKALRLWRRWQFRWIFVIAEFGDQWWWPRIWLPPQFWSQVQETGWYVWRRTRFRGRASTPTAAITFGVVVSKKIITQIKFSKFGFTKFFFQVLIIPIIIDLPLLEHLSTRSGWGFYNFSCLFISIYISAAHLRPRRPRQRSHL